MITTDIMCTNQIVAVAPRDGDGPPTFKKRAKMCSFFGPGTENAKIQLLGDIQVHDAAMPGPAFSAILNCDDVLRSISQQLQSSHAWGQSIRVLRYPFLHASLI